MRIFIDDERFPAENQPYIIWAEVNRRYDPIDNNEWVIVRDMTEVIDLLTRLNMSEIDEISFDHDLGMENGQPKKNGFDIVKWLVMLDMDRRDMSRKLFSDNFHYYVHSQNPIGGENIRGYLDQYLKMK